MGKFETFTLVPEHFRNKVMGLFVPSDIMKSKSNPDFLKKDRSCVSRQLRNIRSKVSLGSGPRYVGLPDIGERGRGEGPVQAAVAGPQGPRMSLAPHT